jgi:UDP:flavonoid glycosyltransferase YjiC (YdhE family)
MIPTSHRPLIFLVAPPFRGHLHPILGIGRALAADFEVVVASTEKVQGAISAAGLPGQLLLPGADPAIQAISDPPHSVGSNPFRLDRQLRANLALLGRFKEELRSLWTARRPDLLIADLTLPIAGVLATEMGIPWWTSHPSPCAIESPDGPPAYLGGLSRRDDFFGRLRDAAGRRLVRWFKRSVFFWYRRQFRALGVPAVYRADGSEAVYSPQKVLGLARVELELPRRLPAAVELVGYPLYTPPHDGPPPPFREGRRHVLVSLGTHLWWRKDAVAAAAAEAARLLPEVEIHFTDGDPASDREQGDGNFHRLGYVSYSRDLARYDLVVHHAGTGVMYYTLAAGLPALTLPTDYDQFDQAARLAEAGLARRLRSPRELPAAITEALGETPERARACAFAEIVRREPAETRIRALVSAHFAGLSRNFTERA